MWCRAGARPTRPPRTPGASRRSSVGRTRLPPADLDVVAAEPVAAAPTRPGPATDVVGLGRWRAAGFVAPALVLIGVFLVFPALWTLYIGATDFRLTGATA